MTRLRTCLIVGKVAETEIEDSINGDSVTLLFHDIEGADPLDVLSDFLSDNIGKTVRITAEVVEIHTTDDKQKQ